MTTTLFESLVIKNLFSFFNALQEYDEEGYPVDSDDFEDDEDNFDDDEDDDFDDDEDDDEWE